ncbi:MAG: hypothetical protein ACRDRY_02995 [Pseudonocardiaceae bacterium]
MRQLRWTRCPEDGGLHLLQPAQIRLAAAGDARALCGRRIPPDGLTITHGPVGGAVHGLRVRDPPEMRDPGPGGSAP